MHTLIYIVFSPSLVSLTLCVLLLVAWLWLSGCCGWTTHLHHPTPQNLWAVQRHPSIEPRNFFQGLAAAHQSWDGELLQVRCGLKRKKRSQGASTLGTPRSWPLSITLCFTPGRSSCEPDAAAGDSEVGPLQKPAKWASTIKHPPKRYTIDHNCTHI